MSPLEQKFRIALLFGAPVAIICGQIATGSEFQAALLLAAAIFFAVLTFYLCGGSRSALGLLLLSWAAKTFLIAVPLKILFGESTTGTLHAPFATALVYAAGFATLAAAVLTQRVLPIPRVDGLLPEMTDRRFFLYIGLLLFGLGIAVPLIQGEREIGGGLIRAISVYRDASIFCLIFWAAGTGRPRPYLHPLVLLVTLVSLTFGVLSTSKQGTLTPMLYYFAGVLLLRGFRDKWILVGAIVALGVFQLLLGPFSDYIRHAGGREGGNVERWKLITSSLVSEVSDSSQTREFRASMRDYVVSRDDNYFEKDVGYLERFALIKTGDKLIASTANFGTTGWSTIWWDMTLFPPRLIYPGKPSRSSNNELARYAGQVGAEDMGTAVAYGLFPHLYNALGLTGVIGLGFVTMVPLLWWWRCFIGDSPFLTFKGIFFLCAAHHDIAEGTYATILGMFYTPVVLMIVFLPIATALKMLRR